MYRNENNQKFYFHFYLDPVSIDVRCHACPGAGVNNAGSFYATTTCQPHL